VHIIFPLYIYLSVVTSTVL